MCGGVWWLWWCEVVLVVNGGVWCFWWCVVVVVSFAGCVGDDGDSVWWSVVVVCGCGVWLLCARRGVKGRGGCGADDV